MEKENLAAIDLGTNSCRITIADCQGKFLYRQAIATKLGEGLYENQRFTVEAIRRGMEAFKEYAAIMKKYNVGKYRAIATASCRMAANGMEFVREVKNQTGIELYVIDGKEDARLNLAGASQNADQNAEYIVVYDLGGGSTEITLAKRYPKLEILHTVSIPWGARNSAEAFSLADYDAKNCRKLQQEITKYVDRFIKNSNLEKYRDKACLISTSSTPLRLVSMAMDFGAYDREKSDGVTVELKKIDEQIEKINKMTFDQRLKSEYIGQNRAEIFISACTIFQTIYKGLKFEKMTASLKGAQDAIIEELKQNGKTYQISKGNQRA